jgi:hypothetical protein
MKVMNDNGITLAIVPAPRGFGYAAFEDPKLIMDWGVKEVREHKLRDSLLKSRVLMHMLQPSLLVLEDVRDGKSRRSKRVKLLIDKLAELGTQRGMTVVRRSRGEMLSVFERMGVHKKHDIARAVAKVVPELAQRLPPRRGEGDSEHYSVPIFEAAALAVTHFVETGEIQVGRMRP